MCRGMLSILFWPFSILATIYLHTEQRLFPPQIKPAGKWKELLLHEVK